MNFLPGDDGPGGDLDERLVGVRPHDLAPTANGVRGAFTLTGELALIEPAGPLHYLDVDVAGQHGQGNLRRPERTAPGAGESHSRRRCRPCISSTARARLRVSA